MGTDINSIWATGVITQQEFERRLSKLRGELPTLELLMQQLGSIDKLASHLKNEALNRMGLEEFTAYRLITGKNAGEVCNREGCTGIMQQPQKHEDCYCHVEPPCSYCAEPKENVCSKCEAWESE